MDKNAFFDELRKLAVSDEDARRSLDRLDALEKSKPTIGQVGRYAGIGAAAGPAISAAGNIIKGEHAFKGPKGALRDIAAQAVKGSLSAGAVPLLRSHMDRQAETHTLKNYLKEQEQAKTSSVSVEEAAFLAAVDKVAFTTSAYSTPLNPHIPSQASGMPPFRAPRLNAAIQKQAAMDKAALLERLVRLGATDVPHTPRLLMRQRSPEELAQLQHSVTNAFKRVEDPIKERVGKLVDKVPHAGAQRVLKGGANLLIENPETIPMQALPIPGLTPAYLGAKRLAEKGIDRIAPVPKLAVATKIAAGAPTRGNFMMASDLPPFRAPRLDRAIQKDGEMLPDFVTYEPGDFKRVDPMKKKANAGTLKGSLAKARAVGAPRVGAPPGPSVAQIAKPRGPGFGGPAAGANKSVVGGTIAGGSQV